MQLEVRLLVDLGVPGRVMISFPVYNRSQQQDFALGCTSSHPSPQILPWVALGVGRTVVNLLCLWEGLGTEERKKENTQTCLFPNHGKYYLFTLMENKALVDRVVKCVRGKLRLGAFLGKLSWRNPLNWSTQVRAHPCMNTSGTGIWISLFKRILVSSVRRIHPQESCYSGAPSNSFWCLEVIPH